MPHVSEFHVTPDHDGHDRLLVAALAADDLNATDRDHALELIRSCAICAELHDDLIAIARATAAAPAPSSRTRDFQLSPADAARLRPSGWRRLLGGIGAVRLATSRPLGVGLATLGLVGLLIGNAPVLSLGSAAAPTLTSGSAGGAPRSAGDTRENEGLSSEAAGNPVAPVAAASAPAASAAAAASGGQPDSAFGTETGPSASATYDAGSAQGGSRAGPLASTTASGEQLAAGQGKAAGSPATAADGVAGREGIADANPFRPLNIAFVAAVLLGLGVLVASRRRGRIEG